MTNEDRASDDSAPGQGTVTDRVAGLLTELADQVDSGPGRCRGGSANARARARLRVLLVGEAKRGKSTVGNALLGREVLPTGVIPMTAVATTVRAGIPSASRSTTATVRWRPLRWQTWACSSPRPETANTRDVEHVVAFAGSLLPHPRVDLIDTPAVGSVLKHNTATAETAMQAMDVAVFVLTMDPPISAAEVELLRRVRALSARVNVVLNKIDQLEPGDRVDTERFTRQVAGKALDTDPQDVPVFPVSARAGVRALVVNDEAAWRASGMAGFPRALQRRSLVAHLRTR